MVTFYNSKMDTHRTKNNSKSTSEVKISKKIEIHFNHRAFFTYPKVKRLKYASIQRCRLSDIEWGSHLMELNKCLQRAFIPIWLWIIILIFSGGLLGFVIIPWQKKKTREAANMLRKFVKEKNEQFDQAKMPIKYEIPLPSKKGVIINVYILQEAKT